MSTLTANEIELVHQGLLSAYPTRAELDLFMELTVGTPLNQVSPPADVIQMAVLKVIRWATARGRLYEVVADAAERREHNQELATAVSAIAAARARNPANGDLLRAAQAIELAPAPPTGFTMEKLIATSGRFNDIAPWAEGFWDMERRVCAIEIARKKRGTGFLVGPSTVMTNYHVVKPIHEGTYLPSQLAARFDYKRTRDGATLDGVAFPAVDSGWLVDFAPKSQLDEKPVPGQLPRTDELDYAIVRLTGTPGSTKAHDQDSRERGWYRLPEHGYEFPADSFLLIAQHPDRRPLQWAADERSVIERNANKTRVTYRTSTEPGSSGAPVFNADLDLVALHHAGDPNYPESAYGDYNQGVPIATIRTLLDARGKLAALEN